MISTALKNVQVRFEHIQKHFPDGHHYPAEIRTRNEIQDYQAEGIGVILKHVYENNAFYRRKFDQAGVSPDDFKSIKDLSRFPFTYKDELRGKPWQLLSVPKKDVCLVHTSTGTTSSSIGDHIYQLHTLDDIYAHSSSLRSTITAPCNHEDVVIVALPYEMSSAGIALHRTYETMHGAVTVNTGKGGFYSDPLKTLIIMRDLGARILLTTPSYALHLAEVAEENEINLKKHIDLKLMWITGEGCSDAFRERLEDMWNCTTLRNYGSMECGPIGTECLVRDGYHACEAYTYFEVIDPVSGKVLPPGNVGELVATTLSRRAAPLVRYRIQDLAYIEDAPCSCGFTSQRIFLRGRIQHQVRGQGSLSVSPFRVEEILYRIPEVGNNYLLVVKPEGMTIQLELKKGVQETAELKEMIRNRVDHLVGNVLDVEVKARLPRIGGKMTRVKYVGWENN